MVYCVPLLTGSGETHHRFESCTLLYNQTEDDVDIENVKRLLCDNGYEDSIVLENPDFCNAIIGVSENGNVVYDYDKMVVQLMEEDKISYEDAADFISYNTINAIPYMGEKKPIIMYRIDGLEDEGNT